MPQTLPSTPAATALPPGYAPERMLSHRPGVELWLARRREHELVVLRLETGPTAVEGTAELAVLAAVEHPGIAPLVDHGELAGGGRFLARAWIEGEDMLAWSRGRTARGRREPREPREIGACVARLCAPLEHLHRLGFVHGDLKPENAIVAEDGRVLLTDFGLARLTGGREEAGVSGSLFSIAPEVLLGAAQSASSDLFALGALLFRLLVPSRVSAREFYGRFPQSGFLDAAGSRPEELPSFARDLVVGLTAREPTRRPRSAADVGRALAARLSVRIEGLSAVADLRFPIGWARESFLSSWLVRAKEPGELPNWIVLPEGEDARGFAEHLRLFAALRGLPSSGIDLAAETAGLSTSGALEEWAVAHTANAARALVAWIVEPDPRLTRAAETLARAAALERSATGGRARVIVVAPGAPSAAQVEWSRLELPPLGEEAVRTFFARELEDPPERCAAFAERLHAASQGRATMLDQLLVRASQRGWILRGDERHRLRPGSLLEPADLAQPGEESADPPLSEGARTLLASLAVLAGRGRAEELLSLCRFAEKDFAAAALELVRTTRARWVDANGHVELVAQRSSELSHSLVPLARELHARRAARLEELGASEPALVHRFAAAPDHASARHLRLAARELLDRGAAERALGLVEGAESAARRLHEASSPILALARAECWCALGEPGPARALLEGIVPGSEPAEAAELELAHAQVARLRHDSDEALARSARAVEIDPRLAARALVHRVQLLWENGRDDEVLAACVAAAPRALEARGELGTRARAFLESMSAMSAFRLGRVEEARAALSTLADEAAALGDLGREGALRIDLATLERRAGSLADARAQLERALALFQGAGFAPGVAQARETLGGLLRELGELAQAEPLIAAALATRERLGDRDAAATARALLGLLQAERGFVHAALETIGESLRSMSEARRARFGGLLAARAIELRARIGAGPAEDPPLRDDADPRTLLALARAALLRGDEALARERAQRAEELARSLQQTRIVNEARSLSRAMSGAFAAERGVELGPLASEDARVLRLLDPRSGVFDESSCETLARELSRRGRSDRAARLFFGLAARVEDPTRAIRFAGEAEAEFEACCAGLAEPERAALKRTLLGVPDPFQGDLAARPPKKSLEDELEMEIVSLLDINKRLLASQDLGTLLGAIVESAIAITGAERGFLVLEEKGVLRFDTALDSCRGDIAQPEFEISRSIIAEALARMQPIRVSNAVDDPMLGHTASVVSLELRSVLCVPIAVEEGLRAAIYLDHRLRTGAFDERAERLATLLASQAALAIQQVRRVAEIQELNHELAGRVLSTEDDLRKARAALRRAEQEADSQLVGSSPAIQRVHAWIERAAPSTMPVLVSGESGTGKELVARSLHERAHRKDGPFVSENCAALPPSLIESELFGYVKGAFTGAARDHAGLFERAHGGTLFLDEIGELPLDLQAKLLRVLETSEVRRIGASSPTRVDFRLVAATNRDLEREVREGRFRQDLFYRLDGLRLTLPTLAERMQDLPELVQHFLRLESGERGKPRRIAKSVLATLARRAWPGNVRELKNEIARLCVLTENDLDDPNLVREPASVARDTGNAPPAALAIKPLAELERDMILRALETSGGDKRKAAELLGISRAKIYQRLKEWTAARDPSDPIPPDPSLR